MSASVFHASTFVGPFAPRPLRRFIARMDPLSSGALSHVPPEVPASRHHTFGPFCLQPPRRSRRRFATLPLSATDSIIGYGLRHSLAGSPVAKAESSSSRTDRSFASFCSPHHLAMVQLNSATGPESDRPGRDFHPPDVVRSQAHECGAKHRFRHVGLVVGTGMTPLGQSGASHRTPKVWRRGCPLRTTS